MRLSPRKTGVVARALAQACRVVERCAVRGGWEKGLGACVGAQVERGVCFGGKKSIRD